MFFSIQDHYYHAQSCEHVFLVIYVGVMVVQVVIPGARVGMALGAMGIILMRTLSIKQLLDIANSLCSTKNYKIMKVILYPLSSIKIETFSDDV